MAVKKKKNTKNINTARKSSKKKSTSNIQMENKLGYDPLAWITTGDIREMENMDSVLKQNYQQAENNEIIVEEYPETSGLVDPGKGEEMVMSDLENISIDEGDENKIDQLSSILCLPDVFNVAKAEDVFNKMDIHYKSVDDLEIDASMVETVDASAIQLLVALKQKCVSHGKSIKWIKGSEKLTAAAKLLGLSEKIGL